MKCKVNKKSYKHTKDSTVIIRQTLIMKLHNAFNVCRLNWSQIRIKKGKLEMLNKMC